MLVYCPFTLLTPYHIDSYKNFSSIYKIFRIFASEIAEAILSLGSNAERKVRAARATMLPNGKRLFE